METPDTDLEGSRKHFAIIRNKRTSISLEDNFWRGLHVIVRMEDTTVGGCIEKASRQRTTLSLSGAVRVAVQEYYKDLAMSHIVVGARPALQSKPTHSREPVVVLGM